jgi:hypothetical protein
VQLDLVNIQDMQADKWVAPKVNNVLVIPKGLKAAGAYAAIVKKAVVKPRKLVLPAGKSRACQGALVSVGGECVPKLKR